MGRLYSLVGLVPCIPVCHLLPAFVHIYVYIYVTPDLSYDQEGLRKKSEANTWDGKKRKKKEVVPNEQKKHDS